MAQPLGARWMLNFDGKKMSKSLGNFEPLSALLERHDPLAIRLLFLQTGYRKPMNFTEDSIGGAAAALGQLKQGISGDAAQDASGPATDFAKRDTCSASRATRRRHEHCRLRWPCCSSLPEVPPRVARADERSAKRCGVGVPSRVAWDRAGAGVARSRPRRCPPTFVEWP